MTKKIIFPFLCVFILCSCSVDEIRKYKSNTIGKIINKINCAKGGYTLEYQYQVNNVIYVDMNGTTIYNCEFESTFRNKQFTVVYSTLNPDKSFMLITPDDFEFWGYEIPDSLNWVRDCFSGL